MIHGSCLCGQVKYVVNSEIKNIIHCHCPSCRKAHAAAFSSVAKINKADFSFESGEDQLKSYESSPGKRRHFCSNCGSQIYAYKEGQEKLILRLGTLDDDPGVDKACHIFTSLKAPWFHLEKKIPQYKEWPE